MKKYIVVTNLFMNKGSQFSPDRYEFYCLSELSAEKLKTKLEGLGERHYNLENSHDILFKENGNRAEGGPHSESIALIKKQLNELRINGVNMRSIKSIHDIIEVKEHLPII